MIVALTLAELALMTASGIKAFSLGETDRNKAGGFTDPYKGVAVDKLLPCNDCQKRADCAGECSSFKSYTTHGKVRSKETCWQPIQAICPCCNSPFIKTRRLKIYCSNRCTKRASAARMKKASA